MRGGPLTTALLVCLLLTGALSAAPEGRLTGRVLDRETGEPMPGVNIMLIGTVLGTTSDAEGRFILTRIPPGTYQVRFSMIGYSSVIRDGVTIRADRAGNLDVAMEQTVIEVAELMVTANKRRQQISDSPTSVAILSRRDFEFRNQVYLNDLLEYVPGVNFVESQINIRGSSGYNYGAGSRVLMLIDGVPVMPGDSGDIKWDLVPAPLIDHVEVIKGAGSALYGSSALGGVVNIITRKALPRPMTQVRFSAGVYDTPRHPEWRWTDRTLHFDNVNVDHMRRAGGVNLYLALGRRQSTGYRQSGHEQRFNGSIKLNTTINGQHNLTLSTHLEGGKRGGALVWRSQRRALEVNPPATGDVVSSNKASANLFHQWAYSKRFGIKTRLSYFRNYWKNDFHDNVTASTAHRYGMEIQGEIQFSKDNALIFGTEESLDRVISGLVGNHDQYVLSGYVQNERELVRSLQLTAGMRYDFQHVDIGFEDSEWSPKIGLVWHARQDLSLRLSSGRGFRAASMSERFADSIYSGLRIVPNEALRSETAWSNEIGLNFKPRPFIYIDIAAFLSDYWDLIEPQPDETQTVQFINVTRARISGIEILFKLSPWPRRLRFELGYTGMDPRDIDLDQALAYRARHLLHGSIILEHRFLEAGLNARYASRIDLYKVYPNDDRVAQKVINVHASAHFTPWTLSVNVNNLLNYCYTQRERILQPMRHYVLTLSAVL